MDLIWKLQTYDFVPTDYTADKTAVVMGVRRGTLVKGVALRVGEAFDGTGARIEIGDGDDAAGFMTWSEANVGSTGLKNGGGAELITQPAIGLGGVNGKLYTEYDTIDLTFTCGTTGTTGIATVYVVYALIE